MIFRCLLKSIKPTLTPKTTEMIETTAMTEKNEEGCGFSTNLSVENVTVALLWELSWVLA